ncbi:hypothetical protein [Bacillus sp. FJAT-18017]|nr:hypothetical protein [Bacillus sp. FJAT-18017]
MKLNKLQNKNNITKSSGTDPQKVKKDIHKDVNAGQGAMTSREAGAMRD